MQRCIALPARCRVGKIQPPPPWTQSFFVSLIKNIAPTPSTQCFFVAWTKNSISLPPSTRSFFVALTKNYFSLPTQHEVVLSRGEQIISLPPPHQRKVSLLRWPKNCISLPTSTRSCFVAWWTNNFSTPTPSTQSFFVALTIDQELHFSTHLNAKLFCRVVNETKQLCVVHTHQYHCSKDRK